jgi:hypothetical protein
LNCGEAEHQEHVAEYLKTWFWIEKEHKRPQVLLALAANSQELMGYGAWEISEAAVERSSGEQVKVEKINVPWFGFDSRFHGEIDTTGAKCAARFYSSLEAVAVESVSGDGPILVELEVHEANVRGQAFWKRRGFSHVRDVVLPSATYHQMTRWVRASGA